MSFLWLAFVVSAVLIAWIMGYRSRPKTPRQQSKSLPHDYLVGLNFLLNDETDKAVDIFIKMLEVDSDTVETHLAVGKLFRKKGEVDRAIRIHQNLIARPNLERPHRQHSLYELGQDYLSAGMFDRAEVIYLDLINQKAHLVPSLKILLDIYTQEKEWLKAIAIARQYQTASRESMSSTIAHLHCELAEQYFQKNELQAALDYVKQAALADKANARASLLAAKIYIQLDDYQSALTSLKKIKKQNPDYLAEAIDMLALCYEKLNQEDELVVYLKQLVDEHPRVPVVLILAERIRRWKGDKTAIKFVADYVRRYPSLRGLYMFVDLYIATAEGKSKEDIHIIHNLMNKILSNKPDYQCTSCGFSGKNLHWQCPGCRQWSTMLPLYTLEEAA